MYSKIIKIVNPNGLHARPATSFVELACTFKSNISIRKDFSTPFEDGFVPTTAKSIIFVLSLGINTGDEVEICAKGVDEKEAVERLVRHLLI